MRILIDSSSASTGSLPVFSREDRERVVDDPLGGRLLAVEHHLVDDLLHQPRAVHGIRLERTDLGGGAARHPELGFLTPYCERAFLRSRHAGGVERPAHDLVAHAREVLDAAAADEHDRVLLQVVALAGNVGGDLDRAGDAHARDLAQRRVRLLRRRRVDARADAAPLRRGDLALAPLAGLQARGRELLLRRLAADRGRAVRWSACGAGWYQRRRALRRAATARALIVASMRRGADRRSSPSLAAAAPCAAARSRRAPRRRRLRAGGAQVLVASRRRRASTCAGGNALRMPRRAAARVLGGAPARAPRRRSRRVALYALAPRYAGIDTLDDGRRHARARSGLDRRPAQRRDARRARPRRRPSGAPSRSSPRPRCAIDAHGTLAWIGARSAIGAPTPIYEVHALTAAGADAPARELGHDRAALARARTAARSAERRRCHAQRARAA